MVASTPPTGDAGHGRQASGSALANRAPRTLSDSAHGGISTESTVTAPRASGEAHNTRRPRDNNDNDEGNPRPSSRPRHATVPCCDCTRHSTCTNNRLLLFVKVVPVARLAEDAFHAHVLASAVTRRLLSRIQQEVSRIFLTRPRPSSPEPTILNLPSLIKRFLQPSPVPPIRL
jgi:hypothetical protein